MTQLPALVALYDQIDEWLEMRRADCKDTELEKRLVDRQRLNDQAYFLLCWGQFEVAIDDTCRRAIRSRQNVELWSGRRGWDLYNPDDKRLSGLSFEDRVALITDRRAGLGSPWARIMRYYAVRNEIAHGRLRPDRIDVQFVVQDLFALQGGLTA